MANIEQIKDMTPNEAMIKELEKLLDHAKNGHVRSVFAVCGWADDSVSNMWSIDNRNSDRRILAEIVIAQHDFVVNIGLKEGDSVLAQNL